jgi:hypothetical protein
VEMKPSKLLIGRGFPVGTGSCFRVWRFDTPSPDLIFF